MKFHSRLIFATMKLGLVLLLIQILIIESLFVAEDSERESGRWPLRFSGLRLTRVPDDPPVDGHFFQSDDGRLVDRRGAALSRFKKEKSNQIPVKERGAYISRFRRNWFQK